MKFYNFLIAELKENKTFANLFSLCGIVLLVIIALI